MFGALDVLRGGVDLTGALRRPPSRAIIPA
jgi:hypothetical protein